MLDYLCPAHRSPSWAPPPINLTLCEDEVHVWRACLDHPGVDRKFLWQVLADNEQARANRFYFPIDRERFVVARGLLRIILSKYLGLGPEQLRFNYNEQGKPFLAKEHAQARSLSFNLSHSHGVALYAITCKREIGVDLEYIKPGFAEAEIIGQIFSPRELLQFKALPAGIRQQAFFNCWTRKEAFVKATGIGLSLAPNQFEVIFIPDELAALLYVPDGKVEISRWDLRSLKVGTDYAAALAVEGHDWRIRCWQFDEATIRSPTKAM